MELWTKFWIMNFKLNEFILKFVNWTLVQSDGEGDERVFESVCRGVVVSGTTNFAKKAKLQKSHLELF